MHFIEKLIFKYKIAVFNDCTIRFECIEERGIFGCYQIDDAPYCVRAEKYGIGRCVYQIHHLFGELIEILFITVGAGSRELSSFFSKTLFFKFLSGTKNIVW